MFNEERIKQIKWTLANKMPLRTQDEPTITANVYCADVEYLLAYVRFLEGKLNKDSWPEVFERPT